MTSTSILSGIPAGCPMHQAGERFQPFEHKGMTDFYASVRPEVPIFYAPSIDCWVVTRREDTLAVLRDHERFSASNATAPIVPWPEEMHQFLRDQHFTNESVQVACDPPRHTRGRNAAMTFLNMKKFQNYEADVRALARSYINEISNSGKDVVDLVESFTYEYPAKVAFLLLGEKQLDARKLKQWADLRIKLIFGTLTHEQQMEAARDLADFWHFASALVEQRKKHPGDDYPSALLAARAGDDSNLTENEVKSLVFGLLLAAHETTTNAAGNLLFELLKRPITWQSIVEDQSLIPNAVEEGLRYATSTIAWRRRAKVDVEIAGVQLPQGSQILLSLTSANRDEKQFADGEIFDIGRSNARSHIAFGNGIHHCLGAPLARMELRILLEELTTAFPKMRLEDEESISFLPTLSFRGPDRLPVRLNG